MGKQKTDPFRQSLPVVALALVFVAAAATQAKVQFFARDELLDLADDTRRYELEKDELARRGTIFSSDGRVLAQSEDAYELGIRYDRTPQSPGFLLALSQVTGLSLTELEPPAEGERKNRSWRKVFSMDQARQIKQVKRDWRADGISLTPLLERSYPMGEAASGIVGIVRNHKPITGYERSLNDALAGRDGSVTGYVDRTGAFLASEEQKGTTRINGQSLTLTIDSQVQQIATLSVRAAVEKHGAKSGCALVLDPKTGYLLAMANWPTIDPDGIIKKGQDVNSAYMDVYEPGSTFKILTLARALEREKVTPGSGIACGGKLTVIGHDIHCAHGAHGQLDLTGAIAKSCNVAAATWALRIGRDDMISFMRDLGLLEKTKLGLPLERPGLFNFDDGGQRLQLANVGFGQALSVTPVALVSAFGMFANGGVRMQAQLIRAKGSLIQPPIEAGQVVSSEVADRVLHMMEATIESDAGTGRSLRIPGYRLAGKTGTAQKLIGGKVTGYVSSFVGYVPAESPKAVVLVMINDPKKNGYYGGDVAGPVFTDIARSLISRFGIKPDRDADTSGGTLRP